MALTTTSKSQLRIKKSSAPAYTSGPGWRPGVLGLLILTVVGSYIQIALSSSTGQQGTRRAEVKQKLQAPRKASPEDAGFGPQSTGLSPQDLGPVLATADFDLLGLAITAGPATQTVPKNTPTVVNTSVQVPAGTDPILIIGQLSSTYLVKGELSGPSLSSPLALQAKVGQPLQIPGLSKPGDHIVQNLRLVDTASGTDVTIASVTPDSVGIVVIDQLLISQVQVNQLTYDQISQLGISITDDSYKYFNFVLGLATTSGVQQISLPVAFPGTDVPNQTPIVGTKQVSATPGTAIPAFDVAPVMLQVDTTDGPPIPQDFEGSGGPIRIPGVIVFPGRIGFLNQFFSAIVIVTNGAPSGTPLVVHDLHAQIVLPTDPKDPANPPLGIAATQTGGVVTDLPIHGLGPDGQYGTADDTTTFSPGDTGQASFLLQGLKQGLWGVNFNLQGKLDGLPIGTVNIKGQVPGSVLVRDPAFSVTFMHPSVVRAGQTYDLAMSLNNTGTTNILGAVAQLPANGISGAELLPGDNGNRAFATTILPKQSSTVVWHLRSDTTGQVTASYVKVGQDISAGLTLTTGVGDRDVPLSPDSLILPDTVSFLPPPVVDAARALLGQAWGVATAPPGALPAGVKPIPQSVVFDHGADLGIAGLRVEFGEPVQVSLETVMRDWLGEQESPPDPGFADALRNTFSGFNWYDTVGARLAGVISGSQQSETPSQLHQELANTESPRSNFVSALVTQAGGAPLFGAALVDPSGNKAGEVTSLQDRYGDITLGASLRLNTSDPSAPSPTTVGQLLLASEPAAGTWTLALNAWQSGNADISLLVPTAAHAFNQFVFSSVQITAGAQYRIRFQPLSSATPILEVLQNGAYQATSINPSTSPLSEPPPRLVGAMQVSDTVLDSGDKYGRLIGVLFSKPLSQGVAETPSHYQIGGGALAGSTTQVGGQVLVQKSKLNFGGRFVIIALDTPVGPFIQRTLTVAGLTDLRGIGQLPATTTLPITMTVSPQGVPPGAYLTGRVLNADGSPVAGALVTYRLPSCSFLADDIAVTARTTDSQGRYEIDYVRNGDCGGPSVSSTNPTTGSVKTLSTPIVYNGQHLVIDLVFLARGNVQGTVTINGAAAPGAVVNISPVLDTTGRVTVQADGAGHYQASSIPVGAVGVSAFGIGSQSNATGFGAGSIDGPGLTATVNIALQNISGIVKGRVVHADNSPAVGTLVAAYAQGSSSGQSTPVGFAYTDRQGNFVISNLPVQTITLAVADYVTGARVTQSEPLTQAATEIDNIVITLPGLGGVSGKVTDETGVFIPNAAVIGGGTGVGTDPLGNYTIPALPAGNVTLIAIDPNSGIKGSITVTIIPGQTITNANIVISRPASLSGTVYSLDSSGNAVPIKGAQVTLDGGTIVTTDATGAYSLGSMQPGGGIIRFIHPNNQLGVNIPVTLNPGDNLIRNATFHSAAVHGTVTQPGGVTGAVAQLSVISPRPDLTQGPGFGLIQADPNKPISTQSAADGTYSVTNMNPGTYSVTAFNSFFPVPVSKGGTLISGDNQQCDLVLVNTLAGKIQGTVFKPDGVTPAGANIAVTLGGGSLADATVHTDQNSHFEFGQVFSSGGYNLTATDPVSGAANQISIYATANQDVIGNIRLLGTGNLTVTVVDGAGNPAQSGSVTIDGTAFPRAHRFADIAVNGSNVIGFANLPEGPYAISATQNGLSARVAATVPNGSGVSITVQLQASGTVTGRVLMPGGTTPVGLADVRLVANGRSIGITTSSNDDATNGVFTFLNVPVGDFSLSAFDNRTGRTGGAAGTLSTQGQTATADIILIAQGAVAGIVTSNGVPVDHATVSIRASSIGLTATTDPTGHYRFTGIPAGSFAVAASSAGLSGSASGILAGTTDPIPDDIVNIALQASCTVTGTVFLSDGSTPVAGAGIALTVGGGVMGGTTTSSGTYTIPNVPLGDIKVRATAPIGFDRGESPVTTASQPGATVTINVTFNGTGGVGGNALDNTGTPLNTGTVTLTNTALSPAIVFNTPVQPGGKYQMTGVPAGPFSIQLTVPGRIGVGSATGVITAGQTLTLPLQLADAGNITGSVKAPDGVTPSSGADVTLTLAPASGPVITLVTHTNSQGTFTFSNVPLGTASVAVSDPNSGGLGKQTGISLTTNGQTVTVSTIVLDNTAITVVSATPANGATAVPITTTATVTFSKPADPATTGTGNVRLLQSGSPVAASVALSADGKTATITPSASLKDNTAFTIDVLTGVSDLVGHQLGSEFRSSFTTADLTPPAVTAIAPANNATQVPVASTVAVTFSKALNATQDLTAVFKLTTGPAPGTAVAGALALDSTHTILTFTPSAALTDSTSYNVSVNGAKDTVGNVQTVAFTSTFATVDLTPPVVDPLPIDGTSPASLTPTISASYHDNFSGINPASVVLTLDSVNVTAQATIGAASLSFTPAAPLAKTPHTVTVQVSDNAGNHSAVRSATFTINSAAPVISSFTIAGQPAVNGLVVSSTFQPAFVATYASATPIDTTATKLLLALAPGTPVPVAAQVTSTGLTFTPASPLSEANYIVQLNVVDTLGNSTTSGPITFAVNITRPLVQTVTPNTGSQHGGTAVTLTGLRLTYANGAAPAVSLSGNPAIVTLATQGTGGAADQVTIVTPAGAPGAATITVTNDHGTASLVAGFTYQADSKTPFAPEADTLLLWHLDEIGNGSVTVSDSSPNAITGIADALSVAAPGRFAGGRTSANVNAAVGADGGFIEAATTGTNSFTAECWVKTAPVTRSYTLVGKSAPGGAEDWSIYLDPVGSLIFELNSTAIGGLILSVPRATYPIDDNQWHYVAGVVDRAGAQLLLYVDGVQRGSLPIPSNFGSNYNQPVSIGAGGASAFGLSGPGTIQFPGTLDEIRVSGTAHTAQAIQQVFQGTAGSLGLVVSHTSVLTIPRGSSSEIDLAGYNLTLTSVVAVDSASAGIPAIILSTSDTAARIQLSPSLATALGAGQVQISSPAGTASFQIQVVDLSHIVPAPESDTLLLWHLDDPAGQTFITDSSPNQINGTADVNSAVVTGMFGSARTNANIMAGPDAGVIEAATTGTNSFSAECWVKTAPVTRSYTLVGKAAPGGAEDWSIYLDPIGRLNFELNSTAIGGLTLSVLPATYAIDDNQWHYVVGVVDRAGAQLLLYVDGAQRGSLPIPSNFGSNYNQPVSINAGGASSFGLSGPGTIQFPGTLDEIRISSSVHSAARISQDYFGTNPLRLTSYAPSLVNRDKSSSSPVTTQVLVNGYSLDNVTAQVQRNGQSTPVTAIITGSNYRQAMIAVSVPGSFPLGAAQLVVSKAGQTPVTANLQVVEQSPLGVAADTLLLWRLDEVGDGAVTILDSSPHSINGTAGVGDPASGDPASKAVPGRFAGGRTNANISAAFDSGFIEAATTGTNSFTAECWVKTTPVTRSYTLAGKTSPGGAEDWSIYLDPIGRLNFLVNSTTVGQFTLQMPRATYPVDDDQWHYIAGVMDRTGGQLLLYVDGLLRSSVPLPPNFGLNYNQPVSINAGARSTLGTGGPGSTSFGGVLDEIRVSSTAHSAAQIATDYFGHDGPVVTLVQPAVIQQGAGASSFAFSGAGLKRVTITSAQQGVTVTGVTPAADGSHVNLSIAADSTVPIGSISFTVTDPLNQTTTAQLTVVNQQPFNPATAGTVLLWHLDDAGNGAASIADSGPNGIGGKADPASSEVVPARFAGGRSNANIAANPDSGLIEGATTGTNSFSAECWVKTTPVPRSYTLVGKATPGGAEDWSIYLDPIGQLNFVINSMVVGSFTLTAQRSLPVDDNQWHYIAGVVDRSAGQLLLYVDGVLRGSVALPANLGSIFNQPVSVNVGGDSTFGTTGPGSPPFPGTLDEIRIMSLVRTAAQIHDTWFGTTTSALNLSRRGSAGSGSPVAMTSAGLFSLFSLGGTHPFGATPSWDRPSWDRTLPSVPSSFNLDGTAVTGPSPYRRSQGPVRNLILDFLNHSNTHRPSCQKPECLSAWFEAPIPARPPSRGADPPVDLVSEPSAPITADSTPRKE